MRQDGPRCDLGRVCGSTRRYVGAHLGAKMGQVRAKMALSCPSWPKWAQDCHFRFQNDQLETILGGILPAFWDLGRERPDSKKHEKTKAFSRFLGVLGVLLEAMLAHLGAMLGYVGPAGRHLGATWRQDEAQERQDEPRWRTGAPRRGKISEFRRWELLQWGSNPRSDTQHPPKNGFSRMGLQYGSPDSDSSWNWIWKTGRLEDCIWKTGRLEDWP